MKPQIYGALREPPNPKSTYALAHSARCKLMLSANRPDRNLRMVLGHAFALDNLLVRIVEIENESVKDVFDNSKPDANPSVESEISKDDDKKAGIGGGAGVTVGETGSLAKPGAQQGGRRISFGNSADFRPSDYHSNGSDSNKRRKSPPPKKVIPAGYENEDSTSSDDYDELDESDFARAKNPQSAIRSSAAFDDVPADPYDDDADEGTGLGLTRFQSASAARPRSPPKPEPVPATEDVPGLEDDDSDEEQEDRPEPPSPPSIPEDLLRGAIAEGKEDEELGDLYESLRRCPCCKQHASTPNKTGVWRVKVEGDKQYAILAEEHNAGHQGAPEIAVAA
jgi:hypothetical protein